MATAVQGLARHSWVSHRRTPISGEDGLWSFPNTASVQTSLYKAAQFRRIPFQIYSRCAVLTDRPCNKVHGVLWLVHASAWISRVVQLPGRQKDSASVTTKCVLGFLSLTVESKIFHINGLIRFSVHKRHWPIKALPCNVHYTLGYNFAFGRGGGIDSLWSGRRTTINKMLSLDKTLTL